MCRFSRVLVLPLLCTLVAPVSDQVTLKAVL
jgi:hypothetical protein